MPKPPSERLAAALRANLKRRKAAQAKSLPGKGTKPAESVPNPPPPPAKG